MRIKLSRQKNQGTILLVCLGGAVIIGIGLVGVLTMVNAENTNVARGQAWNNAMVLSEAGVEEGMALINKYVSSSSPVTSWTTTAASADGWSQSGNVFTLTRNIGAGYYQVWITNLSSTKPVIKSTGTVLWTNGPVTPIARAVLVTPTLTTPFQGPLTVKNSASLNGNSIIDSFNSRDPNYSVNGQYSFSKHQAGGDVLIAQVNSAPTATLKMNGTANIYGHVYQGANSTIQVVGGATIGDTNWIGPGIEPGWSSTDANVTIPDAPAIPVPPYSWTSFPGQSSGVYYLNGGGIGHTNYYQMNSSLSLNSKDMIMVTNGMVVLDVEASLSMGGQSSIEVGANGRLQAWFNANPSFGGSVVNDSGNATNIALYGTANVTSMDYKGDFIGTIYAPYADFTLGGNASLIGAIVAQSFSATGNVGIHFDENLLASSSGSYIITSWLEVIP